MATHELYEGGPANSTLARTQWPAYPFNAADAAFKETDIAQHYGNPYAVVRRVLDFKNDFALRKYFTDNASAANDVLDLILVPKGTLLVATYVEVENAADGGALTMTFGTAGGIIFGDNAGAGVALDMTAVGANFSVANGAWVSANGALSLASAQAILTPDMVQAKLASKANAGLAGFGNLRLNVSAMLVQVRENAATNF